MKFGEMDLQLMAQKSDHNGSVQVDPSVDDLLKEAELEAEHTIGWVRIALGLALFISGILVSSGTAAPNAGYLFRLSALITVGAFLALGFTSILLVYRGWFRSWMAFVLVAGDAIIFGFSLYFGLEGGGLGGNWIAAMPTIWAVPLVLTVGALRYRPVVQIWATGTMMLVLVGVARALSFHASLTNLKTLDFSHDIETIVGRLLSMPPYLMRAVMLALVGLTTALVMVRSRRLLVRAVSETAHRAQLARFLPAEIAPLIGPNDIANWRVGRR